MNEEVRFDRLSDVELRDAWKHEANDFTPWLAQNIDHIAEAVGMPLEITGTEVLVGTFYADILARNPQDDGLVLIENQLEQTDHTHLGQIMTYLAGLEAKTVIWIAPAFREPHLSAIRWLNQHTADGFSFFALRLRVVRIGDSPYAPMFDVIEKPNGWDIAIRTVAEAAQSDASRRRAAFWAAYVDRYPIPVAPGFKAGKEANKWLPAPGSLVLGLFISRNDSGVYLRGPSRSSFGELVARMAPYRQVLEQRLGVREAPDAQLSWIYVSQIAKSYTDEANWPEIIDFMEEHSKLYLATLADVLGSDIA